MCVEDICAYMLDPYTPISWCVLELIEQRCRNESFLLLHFLMKRLATLCKPEAFQFFSACC